MLSTWFAVDLVDSSKEGQARNGETEGGLKHRADIKPFTSLNMEIDVERCASDQSGVNSEQECIQPCTPDWVLKRTTRH